jgi:hypothetical protein
MYSRPALADARSPTLANRSPQPGLAHPTIGTDHRCGVESHHHWEESSRSMSSDQFTKGETDRE